MSYEALNPEDYLQAQGKAATRSQGKLRASKNAETLRRLLEDTVARRVLVEREARSRRRVRP